MAAHMQTATMTTITGMLNSPALPQESCFHMACGPAHQQVDCDCAIMMQITIVVMHVGRYMVASETLSILVAVQILLLWIKVQYFARCVLGTLVERVQLIACSCTMPAVTP